MKKITIIDYDMGNVGSIKNMLEFLGYEDVEISSDSNRILDSTHLILPGVGSFDVGMENLEKYQLDHTIKKFVLELKRPLLGICLGMQLLGNSSEEGKKKGLALIDFINIKFQLNKSFKIPNMGWKYIKVEQVNNPIANNIDTNSRFYFVHTYHAICQNMNNILFTSNHGYDFPAGISNGNIFGVQFHPEKSHNFGMKILENFIEI